MDYVRLGRSGLKVSRLCLGMMSYGSKSWRDWVLEGDEGLAFVKRAFELGINFLDTADVYSLGVSEEITGKAIREYSRREEVILATKVRGKMSDAPNDQGLSRKHILDSVAASLKRLGTDYIDLYQIHRWDYDVPIEETLEALDDLVRMGMVRYIGASSMFAWQLAKAQYQADIKGWTRFVSMQNHYNLMYREEEREMIPFCVEEGIGLIPWSPLARGYLTGSRQRSETAQTSRATSDAFADSMYGSDADFEVVERLLEVARDLGVKPVQLALAWLLHKPGVVSPIIGSTKLAHLEEAVGATDLKLGDDIMQRLEEPYQPHTVLGHQ